MKRIYIILLAIFWVLGLTACGSKEKSLEGYWMAEDGTTISFTSEGKAILEGMSYDYSVYDKDKLSISLLGFASEFKFSVANGVLTITDLNDNSALRLYKSESKQAEIQSNLRRIAIEQAEQERAQKEREEYEKYIASLKARVGSIDAQIATNQKRIVEAQSWIADVDSDIKEVAESKDMLAEQQIELLNFQRSSLCEDIEAYEEKIVDLQAEKEEIIKELTKFGEYQTADQ